MQKLLMTINSICGSVQFSSLTQLCLTLCNPRNHSTPGLPVHHQLPEFTQTHVHWVGDAIQLSNPLSSLLLLPSIFSSIRVFSNESALQFVVRSSYTHCSIHFFHNPSLKILFSLLEELKKK